jgi:uncharacterized membrane protein
MLKKTNSLISFICSFVSIAIVLDYLLWTRTIKASESIEQGIQIKIIAVVVLFLFSLYFRNKAKKKENQNSWLKASGIINIIVVSILIFSIQFYLYIELTK